MVNGLDTFKTYFADYKDCYVLIGRLSLVFSRGKRISVCSHTCV